jgi:hypothetical protein
MNINFNILLDILKNISYIEFNIINDIYNFENINYSDINNIQDIIDKYSIIKYNKKF